MNVLAILSRLLVLLIGLTLRALVYSSLKANGGLKQLSSTAEPALVLVKIFRLLYPGTNEDNLTTCLKSLDNFRYNAMSSLPQQVFQMEIREIFYQSLRERRCMTFETILKEAFSVVDEEYAADLLNEALIVKNPLATYDLKSFTVEEIGAFESVFNGKVLQVVQSELNRIFKSSFIKGKVTEEAIIDLLLLVDRFMELVRVKDSDEDFLGFMILHLITQFPEQLLHAMKKSFSTGIPELFEIISNGYTEIKKSTEKGNLRLTISLMSVNDFRLFARKECSIKIEGGDKVCAALFRADTEAKLKLLLATYSAFPFAIRNEDFRWEEVVYEAFSLLPGQFPKLLDSLEIDSQAFMKDLETSLQSNTTNSSN